MPILTTSNCSLDLDCYPKANINIQQPWDAADLYLIEEAHIGHHVAIVNDQWGALTCFASTTSQTTYSWTDSYCSQLASQNNLAKLSAIDLPNTTLASGIPSFPAATDSLWIQCPKSFDQLHWWLSLALIQVGPGVRVFIAGMAKHIPIKWLNWLETHNDNYQQYPIKKKARLMSFDLGSKLPPITALKSYLGLDNEPVAALPGVFSRDHMDIGSRFFIHHLSQRPALSGKVVDLGCGNGLLSTAVLKLSKPAALQLILCDDSALALNAAEQNLSARGYQHGEFHHTDALLGIAGPIDTILCNPPFHSGNRVSTAAAERMFKQASKVLAKEGQLLVIANRHLAYAASLKKLFKQVQLVASDAKFVIYCCKNSRSH